MNKILITGYLGQDAALNYSKDGLPFTRFSLAVTIKPGNPPLTQWYNILVFGKRAEGLSQLLKKGHKILVEGGLTAKPYINKNNQAAIDLSIHATNIEFIDTKSQNTSQNYFDDKAAQSYDSSQPLTDECPF